MLKVLLLAVVSVLLLTIVKHERPEFSVLLKITVVAAIMLLAFGGVQRCVASVSEIFALAHLDSAYFVTMLKILGLCITAQITENICRDCGELALASTVETVAKCSILLCTLPAAKELLTICLGWLQ